MFSCATKKTAYINIPADTTTYICDSTLGQKITLQIDTIRNFQDHPYAIGQIGKCYPGDKIGFKIGKWTQYYKSGSIKCQGNYGFGVLRNCGTFGYEYDHYSYKLGRWIYYYEDRTVKADIIYDIVLESILSRNCGDTVYYKSNLINPSSKFYDSNNRLITVDSILLKSYLRDDQGLTYE